MVVASVALMYNMMYNWRRKVTTVSDLVRKQFYITKTQEALLKSKAKEVGLTEAELVRQAIDAQVGKIG